MSRMGLLFPGQGAQAVGMGRELAAVSPAARAVFDAANDELRMEMDRLCFEGPIEGLSRSDIAQPAILTVSVAALRAMEEAAGRAVQPEATAGLSLGEYTALVAAGALDFREAVRLVRSRGLCMQEACEASPGTMYSIIGLDDGPVEDACAKARAETGGGVWPANYNSPGQVVISGEKGAAAAAARRCTEAGARRAIELNVAGAFHTPLMQSAADKLAPHVRALALRRPACPVIANVTGQAVAEPDEVRALLLRQVTSPVRWVDCQRWFVSRGVSAFCEVGPGRVLQGLLKRTEKSANCMTICEPADVRAYVQGLSGSSQG